MEKSLHTNKMETRSINNSFEELGRQIAAGRESLRRNDGVPTREYDREPPREPQRQPITPNYYPEDPAVSKLRRWLLFGLSALVAGGAIILIIASLINKFG